MNQFDGKTLNINATAMTFGEECIQLLPMHAIVVSQVASCDVLQMRGEH